MFNLYDIAYALGITAAAPVWAARSRSREKVLRAFGMRMGHMLPREGDGPAILIHAVSLGEINATSQLIKLLHAARPDLHVVVSTTTVTGYDRGRQLYGGRPGVTLVRFPLDFTVAINNLLDAIRPSAVVLMEGEIWPNFLLQCERRQIPVLLVNGRITSKAFKRYHLIAPITRRMLRRIATLCAQEEIYADRFRQLGAPADCMRVTGTMKFDTAQITDRVDGAEELAIELGLTVPTEPGRVGRERAPDRGGMPPLCLWVCGSTGPGEEPLLLDVYRTLLGRFPDLRLVIVPRKPERFDDVAELILSRGFKLLRRSTGKLSEPAGAAATANAVILGDTMGELRKFFSLADVVFVGRSLVDLGASQHGSDMIEPAALAKPVAIGPWTQNFADAVRRFLAADAMREVRTPAELTQTLARWLTEPSLAIDIGRRAQQVVRDNQGATPRHVKEILNALDLRPVN